MCRTARIILNIKNRKQTQIKFYKTLALPILDIKPDQKAGKSPGLSAYFWEVWQGMND